MLALKRNSVIVFFLSIDCYNDPLTNNFSSALWPFFKSQIILDAAEQVGGIYVVTADHGNAEDMVKRNKSGQPLVDKNGKIQILTSHTLRPVSFVFLFLC